MPSQLAARIRPLCHFVCLRSKFCYALLSASPRGYALRFPTVAIIGSDWLLSSNSILPMLGTLRRYPDLGVRQASAPLWICATPAKLLLVRSDLDVIQRGALGFVGLAFNANSVAGANGDAVDYASG